MKKQSLANNILRTEPVQWRKLKWLQGNLKSATPEDAAKLKASLIKHDFIRPFKVWKNWILDGHLLQKVMQEMESEGVKIPDKLPAEFVRCKNLKHAKELVLVYSSFYHKVDEEQLEIYLTESDIKREDVADILNLPDIALSQEASDESMKDNVPPKPKLPKTRIGDLYEFGNHRLLCASAFDKENRTRLFSKNLIPDLLFADPPYDFDDAKTLTNSFKQMIQNGHILLMHEDHALVQYLKCSSFTFKRFFILDTGIASPRGNDPYVQHILVSLETAGEFAKHINQHDGFRSIHKIEYRYHLKEKRFHEHQKSLQIVGLLLKHYCTECVIDPFAGSGTTAIAADIQDKHALLIEMDSHNCDTIIQRWVNFTNIENIKVNGKTIHWKANRT